MKNSARNGKWVPSPRQAQLLESAAESGFNRGITAIAKGAGVPRRTLYNWLESDEGFQYAWKNLWRRTVRSHVPGVVSALTKKAQLGDVPAGKIILELAGVLSSKTVHEHTGVNLAQLLLDVKKQPKLVAAEVKPAEGEKSAPAVD